MQKKRVSDSFFGSFNANHVLLYVGRGCSDDELKEIAQCPWSAVITSRKDPELVDFFATEGRTLQEYSSREEIPARPLHRQRVPVLRLFGTNGDEENEDEDLSWLSMDDTAEDDRYRAKQMLELIPDLLDSVNTMAIVGADSEADWDLFGKGFARLLYRQVADTSVTIWNMPEQPPQKFAKQYQMLYQVANQKHFGFYTESLSELLNFRKEEDARYGMDGTDRIELPEDQNDIYYQGHTPVSIPQSDLLIFKNLGTLLTERTINRIHPLGRIMSQKWFSNFLETSSLAGPQWYGYLPQSTFYVKRSFEDALVQLVRKMLDGKGITGGQASNHLVVLQGDPGSSKSITLGALAYRIYNEKINPVIFISRESFLNSNIGTNFQELDDAMQFLEKKSSVDTRILVIWDSSTYRTGVDQARKLMSQLQNRGRRFVLVCSSYNMYSKEDDKITAYRLCGDRSGKFEECSSMEAQVYDKMGCYFVKAIRNMNSQEQFEFWKRVKEYSGISEAMISRMKQRITNEGHKEIFDFYYLLISVLRENLENGLRSEQSKISPYVEQELRKAMGEIRDSKQAKKEDSPMWQALVAAGMDPDFLKMLGEENVSAVQQDEDMSKRLELFNICVAMFSRFKLSVPYGLAYTILLGDDQQNRYTEEGRKFYKIVTTDIPWIYYGEDENGEFSFRFRNPLEAEIFLRNHDLMGEQQVDLLCRIIDLYGEDYRESRCADSNFTDNLQALLRLMGPNSGYTPFSQDRHSEHEKILERLDRLIDELQRLRDVHGVADEDAGFAIIIVTFTREYYGHLWDKRYAADIEDLRWEYDSKHFSPEMYEKRIEKLIAAIMLADQSVDALEDYSVNHSLGYSEQHMMNQRYTLAIENAQCNMRLEDLIEEYIACCDACGVEPKANLINRKLSYSVLYRQLVNVITRVPTNGYAYNALFKAFERMYQKQKLTEAMKLQYLSEIMQVVEICETLDTEIVNRGSGNSDELTGHINKIKDLSTGLRITLESISRHRRGEEAVNPDEQLCFDIYDEMLQANNAAAITFVCQKELRLPRGTRNLNTDQLMRCRKVYSFMMEEDNFECIQTNAYALGMLIRVCWMQYNETTLTSSPECQTTKLNKKQWEELYRLCATYDDLSGEDKKPLITLVYALSALQVSGFAEYGFQQAQQILNSIHEDQFYQRRMWTPFILCDENGPIQYTGTVINCVDRTGYIRINRIPLRLNNNVGVRFHQHNLGRKARMPSLHQVLSGLELGIGYTAFTVYTDSGRQERSAKRD